MTNEDSLYSTDQAARHLAVASATLHSWRSRGRGPRFLKIGALVRYRLSDLDEWAQSRVRDPGSQQPT